MKSHINTLPYVALRIIVSVFLSGCTLDASLHTLESSKLIGERLAVTNITPNFGPLQGGTLITLAGSGFTLDTAVTIGGFKCLNPIVVKSSTLTCTTPSGSLGPADVSVSNTMQVSSLTNGFTYGTTLAAVLANVPVGAHANATVDITVGGVAVTHYKYKIGIRGSTDCTDPTGYSSAIPIGTKITDVSSVADGNTLRLCTLGGDNDGIFQSPTNATFSDWFKGKIIANFLAPDERLIEANQSASLNVNLDYANTVDTILKYNVQGFSIGGVDHTLTAGTITVPAGSLIGTLNFDILDNVAINSEKSIVINLEAASSGVQLGVSYVAKKLILDDDQVPYPISTKVSSGGATSCVITSSGVLRCFGKNDNGQIGDGTTLTKSSPTVVNSGTSYNHVSTGSSHSCGITTLGALRCWGVNTFGKLGDGSATTRLAPVTINMGISYAHVSAGGTHTCGIRSDGELRCWGFNSSGQLGDGSTTNRNSPAQIHIGVDYTAISAGGNHTCGITEDSELRCWGTNMNGRLGDGTTTQRNSPTLINDPGITYAAVSAGEAHSCGITTDGNLKCWGINAQGRLGDGTTTQRTSPVIVNDPGVRYATVSAGVYHTCGITDTGVLKCWGYNLYGQLGDGTMTDRYSPTVIDSGVLYGSVIAGLSNTCAVTTAGEAKCWGSNTSGEIGGAETFASRAPKVIESNTAFMSFSYGHVHFCGLTSAGILKCGGHNADGRIGDESLISRNYAVAVDASTTYSTVSPGHSHSCAITAGGVLKCWGFNYYGQLGDETNDFRMTPTRIDAGTTYSSVSVGTQHTCGITSADSLKCWGQNGNGQLGSGTAIDSNTPIVVDPGVSYKSVTTGDWHTCGITSNDTVKCWGRNSNGELGDNTTTSKNNPTPVVDLGVTYMSVSAKGERTCGITSDNILKCWGRNQYGQVGDGTVISKNVPTPVADPGEIYTSVSTGVAHTCGITTLGVLKCWGLNDSGQIGDTSIVSRNSPVIIDAGTAYGHVTTGGFSSCGRTTTSELRCWGNFVVNSMSSYPYPMRIFRITNP